MPELSFFSIEGPLEIHPALGQCRAANLTRLAAFVQECGRDSHSVLADHGLDARTLCDPENLIATKQLVDILEDCSATFGDPLFGLHMAAAQDADVFGSVTALCRAAPTLRASIECLIDYLPVVHAPGCQIHLMEGNDTVQLAWTVDLDLGANDQANFQAAMLNLKLLRAVGGKNFKADWISLSADPRARDQEEIERLLGCRTHLRQPYNAIGFSAIELERRVSSANRIPFRLLLGYLESLKAVRSGSMTDRVLAYIRGTLPSGHCSLDRCAENLALSTRTLQTRLASEGAYFSDLIDHERQRVACVFLSTTAMSLDEIAERLGYGEQTSFGRAFKRWTGGTPCSFRRDRRVTRN